MKQILRKGIKDIIVEEVPDPVLEPHHVLIRPAYSLISSGTETASIHAKGALGEVLDHPSHLRKVLEAMKVAGPLSTAREVLAKFSEYAVLGYAGAGIIVDKHASVIDLALGTRVAYGGEGTGHAETVTTGRNLVARVPDAVPLKHACFATLGSIAMNAVRIANIGLGDRVVILGVGLVGQLIAQLARLQGGVVIVSDLRADRVELARNLGALFGFLGGATLPQSIAAVTDGRGADCVIVAAAARSVEPCRQAVALCRDRGRIVVVGAVDMSFLWHEMYLKEIQVFMSRAYGPGSYDTAYEKQGRDYPISYVRWTENRNMEEFLRLAELRQVQLQPLITHEFDLEDGTQAYNTIQNSSSHSLAVLVRYAAANVADPSARFTPQRTIAVAGNPSARNGNRLGVALVGCGNLARWAHLPNLKKIPGAKLLAVHSSNGARAKSYGLRFAASYCTSDYAQILDDPGIEVVLVTSRNQHHAEQTVAALHAGKHVFVEKPLALTEQECSELYEAAVETGRQLTVGFNRRFAPQYRVFKEHLSRRSSPAVIHCRVDSPGISGSYWMADPAFGGAILGEACHFVDLMYWMLDAEPVSVSAYSLPIARREPIGQNNVVASILFSDGSIGSLTYCTVGSRISAGERIEAFAPGIGLCVENFKHLSIQTGICRNHRQFFPDKGYAGQLRSFLEGISKGNPPEVGVRDGIRATLVCLRIMEACRDGMPRTIDLDRFS